MNKQELLSLAEQQTKDLELRSQNMTYLKDFTKMYNDWTAQANRITKTKEDYINLVNELNKIIDSAIHTKLVQAHSEEIDRYIPCLPASKSFINNKYIRYKIFDTCACLISQSSAGIFLDTMKTIYFKTKSLYRGFASTDDFKKKSSLVELIRNSVN